MKDSKTDSGKYSLIISRRLFYVLIIILSLLLGQLCIAFYQGTRYDIDNYNCVGMSKDCEVFFESIGIRTYQVTGVHYSSEEHGLIDSAHRWILLEFFGFCIPFESTGLIPFYDPTWGGFKCIRISEGYVVDGKEVNEPVWEDWY